MVPSAATPAVTGRFFLVMALVCALIAFLGFAPTYWAPLAAGTLSEAPIVHLHGLLFSAWSLFFVTQAALIANGRARQHRALGLLGIALASAMLFVGLATAIHSAGAHIAAGFGDRARGFMIVPVTTILFFAVAVAVAIANRGRPEVHKRWMVVASVAILMAAVARIVRFLRFGTEFPPGPPPIEMSVVPALGTDLLIVAAILYDWRTRGRPHPAYWVAGGAWLAIQLLRIPFSRTPAWHAVADWLLAFAA
ncbi:MAG TPA: hypothetical protein VH856_07050 [Steroidobacteraceae bacterium]|jgi:hypothetical protein